MKQLLLVLLKLLGFYFLFTCLSTLIQNAFYLYLLDGDAGAEHFILVLIQPIIQLILFYLLVFRTAILIKPFKIDLDVEISVSSETVLKSGIFFIGFYFFLNSFPFALIQFVKWLIDELSTTSGNSLEKLLELFSPFHPDSFINSLVVSLLGFFVAYQHKKIASYFIRRSEK